MSVKYEVPPTFRITFEKSNGNAYQIRTSQVLPVPLTKAFSFFESPENLAEITPDWLDFRMLNREEGGSVLVGAEFHYTIRWFSVKLHWYTKITEYKPPKLFTDVQVKGQNINMPCVQSEFHAFRILSSDSLREPDKFGS